MSGSGNHGTLTNFGACPTTGWRGTGTSADPYRITLDGSANYVRITDSPEFALTKAITVAAWARATNPETQEAIVSQYATTDNKRVWQLDSSASVASLMRIFLSEDGQAFGVRKLYLSSLAAFDTTWHHLAFTYSNDTLYLYIDGVQDPTVNKADDNVITSLLESDLDIAVGATINSVGPGRFFEGEIAVVNVWNRGLSAAEVLSMCQLHESRFSGVSCGS